MSSADSAKGLRPLDSRRAPPCTRRGFRPRPQAAIAAFLRCGGDCCPATPAQVRYPFYIFSRM